MPKVKRSEVLEILEEEKRISEETKRLQKREMYKERYRFTTYRLGDVETFKKLERKDGR